ncbi:MAG TPA: hypothetical protein VGL72_23675 [Bryobacteraceae bacterium]
MKPETNDLGAGSGGSPVEIEEMVTQYTDNYDGVYALGGNRIEFMARPPLPPAPPLPSVISLVATGLALDGRVEVRGSQGVRITTGPPMLPPATSESTNGVEIIASEAQNITIQRGLIPDVDQKIEMDPGSIMVDGGVGTITIQSLTEIKIQVAGGVSSITLTPAGIIIQGPLVMIN